MNIGWRLLALAAVCVSLSGCWVGVRIEDELALRANPAFAGRWLSKNGEERMEFQVAVGSANGCSLLQIVAETESYRWCELQSAGDYSVLAALELNAKAEDPANREYGLMLAHRIRPNEFGLVLADSGKLLQALSWPQREEIRNAECQEQPPAERAAECSRYVLNAGSLPPADAKRLAELYAKLIEKPSDETIFVRIDGKHP